MIRHSTLRCAALAAGVLLSAVDAFAQPQPFRMTSGAINGTSSAQPSNGSTRCMFACGTSNGNESCDTVGAECDPFDTFADASGNSGNFENVPVGSSTSGGTSGGLDDPNLNRTLNYVSIDGTFTRLGGFGGFSIGVQLTARKGNAVGPRGPVTGACCLGVNCSILTGDDCAISGGSFLGAGTACGANGTCPRGACCVGAACTLTTRDECNTAGGRYFGPGAPCAAAGACPSALQYSANAGAQNMTFEILAMGACCLDSFCFTAESAQDCGNRFPPGRFRGTGTVCEPACPAADAPRIGVVNPTFTETGTAASPSRISPESRKVMLPNGQRVLVTGTFSVESINANLDQDTVAPLDATVTYELRLGPPPTIGACCQPDGSCTFATPAECEAASGRFAGFGSICDTAGAVCRGACCSGSVCTVTTPAGCANGSFFGVNTTCAADACVGACCVTDPFSGQTCILDTPAVCSNRGGVFRGSGTVCDTLTCDRRACCLLNGDCIALYVGDCWGRGGVPSPFTGTACAPTTCAGPCCTPDGLCSARLRTDCQNLQGTFIGYFSTCLPTTCLGACCAVSGDCSQLTAPACGESGGIFRGIGSSCLPDTCNGACCRGNDCTITSVGDCRAGGTTIAGVFLGTDTTCDGTPCCCHPWDNGRPDGRGGQASSLGVSSDWRPMVNAAFDDLWLCEGSIHDIDIIRGTLNTNATLPKAIVAVFPDCNGLPDLMRPLAVAGLSGTRFHVSQEDVPFVLGEIGLDDSGTPDADGYRPIGITATFGGKPLVLRGGAYWVTIVGFSADLNPFDEYFWATSGNLSIKGRPGQFFDGEEFRGSEELCCGCTDYNFCVIGETCKILLDNGGPLALDSIGVPGSPSLQNGASTQTRSRAADRFVFPPCTLLRPCYVEAWLWTNCDRAGLEFYPNGCACPPSGPLAPGHLTSDCVMATGVTTIDGSGVAVELKKFQFFLNNLPALEQMLGRPSRDGANVWISVFGLGDNRQNARAYFAYNHRCERPCDQTFGPGCIRSAPADQNLWRSNATVPSATTLGRDYAFMIAVTDLSPTPPPAAVVPACPADLDRSGTLTVQDLFDFLAAWFAGCP